VARRRLPTAFGKLEYAVVIALVAGAVTLVLLAVHHGTPSVFSNISTRLGM
jgi:Flp pilus assembly pilin Flp